MKRFALLAALLAAAPAHADVVTGSYTFGGNTTPAAQTGPWNVSALTNSDFSVLRFIPSVTTPFSDYTSLSYSYDALQGGIGGGSPRAVFVLNSDVNNDMIQDSFIVHWGPAGSFVDATIANGLNTGNLLALTDLGRYDLGGAGGSAYTDRTTALSLIGSQTVNRISLIVDTFGSVAREFVINGVSVDAVAAVPEASAFLFAGLATATSGGVYVWRRRRS